MEEMVTGTAWGGGFPPKMTGAFLVLGEQHHFWTLANEWALVLGFPSHQWLASHWQRDRV